MKYTVNVSYDIHASTVVEVEAESEEHAKELAESAVMFLDTDRFEQEWEHVSTDIWK